MKVRVPGGERCWTELMPEPFFGDPDVFFYLLPTEARLLLDLRQDSALAMVQLPYTKALRCLQVWQPELSWTQQADLCDSLGVRMLSAAWEGRLSQVPQRMLLHGFAPVAVLRDRPWFRFCHLTAQLPHPPEEQRC